MYSLLSNSEVGFVGVFGGHLGAASRSRPEGDRCLWRSGRGAAGAEVRLGPVFGAPRIAGDGRRVSRRAAVGSGAQDRPAVGRAGGWPWHASRRSDRLRLENSNLAVLAGRVFPVKKVRFSEQCVALRMWCTRQAIV